MFNDVEMQENTKVDNICEENVENIHINQPREENKSANLIKDNGILLISEIQDKVILPYTSEEVQAIIDDESNYYRNPEEVIEAKFTRPLSYYRDVHMARMKESIILLTERESFSKLDGINLGLELFGKRYLHPAIISACKNLDELNVYLDCLEKNELDDFKIFEIKYELHPILIDQNKKIYKVKGFWEKLKEIFIKIFSIKNYNKDFFRKTSKH